MRACSSLAAASLHVCSPEQPPPAAPAAPPTGMRQQALSRRPTRLVTFCIPSATRRLTCSSSGRPSLLPAAPRARPTCESCRGFRRRHSNSKQHSGSQAAGAAAARTRHVSAARGCAAPQRAGAASSSAQMQATGESCQAAACVTRMPTPTAHACRMHQCCAQVCVQRRRPAAAVV